MLINVYTGIVKKASDLTPKRKPSEPCIRGGESYSDHWHEHQEKNLNSLNLASQLWMFSGFFTPCSKLDIFGLWTKWDILTLYYVNISTNKLLVADLHVCFIYIYQRSEYSPRNNVTSRFKNEGHAKQQHICVPQAQTFGEIRRAFLKEK